MDLDTIQQHLKGYFINRIEHNEMKVSETLCRKLDNNNYEVLENVKTPAGIISAYDHCLNQVNNQLLNPYIAINSLNEILPTVQGNIFESYRIRENQIEKHIRWCECVETEANKYSDGKYVIKWKKPKGFVFAIVDGDRITEINEILLEDHQIENAVRIKYPKLLQKAIKDDLNNEFEDLYLQEVEIYNNI